MQGLISRQAAIDEIREDADWLESQGSDWQTERKERDFQILTGLPSAQPSFSRDHGNDHFAECSKMDISDDIKNAYFDGYDNGYNAGFEAGQRDVLLKETQLSREGTTSDPISRQAAIGALYDVMFDDDLKPTIVTAKQADTIMDAVRKLPSAQPEQRWIPCGKCIHADGKHRWCKILDRTINEDYFCYWAEPYREEGDE